MVGLDAIVDGIFVHEGSAYADQHSHPPIDQPTGPGGITLPVLSAARNRPCTVADLKALSVADARVIVRANVERQMRGLGFDRIASEPLRLQMLDFSWNSGAERAIRWLQRTIGLTAAFVDGRMGPRTFAALAKLPPYLVNNALAAERAHAAYHGGTAAPFAAGVAKRAIDFVVALDSSTGVSA